MFSRSHPNIRCFSCQAILIDPSSAICPRCNADNQNWQTWTQAGLWAHFNRFFFRSPWGWLALISLFLPPLSGIVFRVKPFTAEAVILSISPLLSLLNLTLLFVHRDALWLDELTRRASGVSDKRWPRFRLGLLLWGSVGFLMFIGVGGFLATIWGLTAWQGGRPIFIGSAALGATLIGSIFIGQTLAAGLYAVYAYGRWLFKTMPKPIFWKEARLLALVGPTAKSCIQDKTGWSEMILRVVESSRIPQAGLRLKIRAELATNQVREGHFLNMVQHWVVMADKWGHITWLEAEGALEYLPDPARVYPPPVPALNPAIEGELIFPTKPPLPTLEEAIILAITSDH